ncbi:hypothetical protein BDY19DRAFT_970143 [Irpex rosettiformis]|uniref:Uncharacterized protein n=1 Tax=Irpex rosettiformis TaxID=378272 RepID=A0ACB8TRJ7_9APHY|nr:hypothetical protein BDY19DRAFT_970143 [Irpex rosettiformis]
MATDFAVHQHGVDDLIRCAFESGTPASVALSNARIILALLTIPLPPSPPFYDAKEARFPSQLKLKDTKKLTDSVLGIPTEERLEKVVYAHSMLRPFLNYEREQLVRSLNGSGPHGAAFLSNVHPECTPRIQSPRCIYSEDDVATLAETYIFHPVITAVRVQRGGSFNLDSMGAEYPYLASCAKGSVIPDRQLLNEVIPSNGPPGRPNAAVAPVLCVEYKTERVFQILKSRFTIEKQKTPSSIFSDLQQYNEEYFPEGCAVQFLWPENVTAADSDKLTRVLVQIWLEMKISAAVIITSYDSTIFCVRNGNTLYLSPTYHPVSQTPGGMNELRLATYCFFKYALGLYPENLNLNINLPSRNDDTREWPSPKDMSIVESFGVVHQTLCSSVVARRKEEEKAKDSGQPESGASSSKKLSSSERGSSPLTPVPSDSDSDERMSISSDK